MRHESRANGLNQGQTHREVGTQSQRICGTSADRPAAGSTAIALDDEVLDVMPNLARLTWAVATVARYSWVILILVSLALSLGAGIKWEQE
jgi:hypothetical protein